MHESTPATVSNNSVQSLAVELLGCKSKISHEKALNEIICTHIRLKNEQPLVLAHQNMHSLALMRHDKEMFAYIGDADYVWIDGMPIIWMLKILSYPIHNQWRLTFLDWQFSFWEMADKYQYRIFLLGGKPGVLECLLSELESRYPKLNIDFHHGYFGADEAKLIGKINTHQPDVLMVGLGMPLQEKWLLRNKSKLNAGVIMPVGGYFDYVAGLTYTPPRWSGKLGLEWLFRLMADPVRLWKRYLLEPLPVLVDFAKDFAQRKWRD